MIKKREAILTGLSGVFVVIAIYILITVIRSGQYSRVSAGTVLTCGALTSLFSYLNTASSKSLARTISLVFTTATILVAVLCWGTLFFSF